MLVGHSAGRAAVCLAKCVLAVDASDDLVGLRSHGSTELPYHLYCPTGVIHSVLPGTGGFIEALCTDVNHSAGGQFE